MRWLLPLVVAVLALGAKAQIGGGISQVLGNLNPDQGDIVKFAFSQLAASTGNCKKEILRVENFSQQVVAGTLFRFDLVLGDDNNNAPGCPFTDASTGSCSIVVWEKAWENFREVQWEDSTCEQDTRGPISGGITKVDSNNLSAEHREIATYGFEQLSQRIALPGGCTKRLLRVENFGEQVVAGTLYHFDLVLKCGNNVEPSCSMKVLDVPWEGGKSVLWERSTCDDNESADISFDDNIPIPGGITQTDGKLSTKQQQIVNFGFNSLLDKTARPGSTTECSLRRVENFREQVVAGFLYQFDFVLSCDGSPTFTCSMKVLDSPSGRQRLVQWGRSDCDDQVLEF